MSASIVIFTFSGDAEALLVNVPFLRARYPHAKVSVIDDAASPLSGKTVRLLKSYDCFYRQSSFARRGNLNGFECVIGILEELQGAARRDGTTRVVKLDTDTFIVDPTELLEGTVAGFESLSYNLFSGTAYAIETGALPALLEHVKSRVGSFFNPNRLPEDQTIASTALRLFGPNVRVIAWGEHKLAAYDLTHHVPENAYVRHHVITFGTRSALPEKRVFERCITLGRPFSQASDVRRQIVAEEMAAYLERHPELTRPLETPSL